MTRQQQMDSEDVQRALEMLWCVTPECICSNDCSEWKRITDGVLLCRDRGIGGTGKFYLWDGRDRQAGSNLAAFARELERLGA